MKNKNSSTFFSLIEKIKSSKKICIASHINPDGDSIGSSLAMGLALKKLKSYNIKIAYIDSIPEQFKFLPGLELLQKIDINEKFDLLMVLDCGDLDRLGAYKFLVEKADYIVNIDHHISNSKFGKINVVEETASATGELIYNILEAMNVEIDKEIATCLYVAISTDTGSFKYDNTTPTTHKIAAKLLEKDIDLKKVTTEVYQSRSLKKTKLFIKSISTMELYCDNKVAIAEVTQEMLKKIDATLEDIDGIIEFIRDIDTVEVACILKEIGEKEIRVGLRSKKYVDVAKIAQKFNGGGHIRASGCTINDSLNNTKHNLLNEIKKNIR